MGRRSNNQKKKKSKNIGNLSVKILKVLKESGSQPLNYKQIAAKLGLIDASSRNQIIKNLSQLAAKKQIEMISMGKYIANTANDTYEGKIDVTAKGNAYVIVDELEEDVVEIMKEKLYVL